MNDHDRDRSMRNPANWNWAAAQEYVEKLVGPTDIVDRHHRALRNWARGTPQTAAAVEMLIRGFGGRYASGWPWIIIEDERRHVQFTDLVRDVDSLPPPARLYLRTAASIALNQKTVTVAELIGALDRTEMNLVLAAMAHAAGFIDQLGPYYNPDNGKISGYAVTPSIHPWPAPRTF